MEKLYKKTGWKNKPNLSTPLGASNLKKIDEALDGLDNRTIELNNKDAEQGRHIEELYAETRNNTQAIEEVRESTQYIDSSKIVTNKSGAPVYIDDASNMNIENIVFYGESKQVQTTGKNLLQNTAVTRTDAGLTYTVNSDGSVTVNGTATGLSIVKVGSFKNTDKDLILSGCPSGGNTNTYKLSYYHETTQVNDFGSGVTLPKNDLTYEVRIVIYGSTKINNLTFYPMIRLSSANATYEPYTGGKASPNPDYPQYIEGSSVGSVRVYRKNLLNENGLSIWTHNGITFTPVYENGLLKHINVNGTATANAYYTCKSSRIKSGSYVLSGFENPSSNIRSYINSGGAEIASDVRDNGNFNLASDADVTFVIKVSSGVTMNNVKCYPMIRPTFFTDGTYEPYESQFASLTSSMYFLDGIGDLKNYIDLERGVLVEKVKNVTLNGSEAWYKHDEQYPHLFKTSITPYANGNVPLLCSHFPYDSGDLMGGKDGCRFRLANSADVFYVSSSQHTDASAFKSWLASNPVTLVYPLAEAEETELPKADIDAIKALHTYRPNTIVDAQDTLIDVQYVADTRIYVDKKIEALANSILSMVN